MVNGRSHFFSAFWEGELGPGQESERRLRSFRVRSPGVLDPGCSLQECGQDKGSSWALCVLSPVLPRTGFIAGTHQLTPAGSGL